ncbi:MAG: DUF523 domain-containing protein [Bacillota bacterium]|nr:DUF523 domain-containing protein [Bacillota bacterium]MDW7677881.1 DUF523 domain-containing protein [Bacillota bacterium]
MIAVSACLMGIPCRYNGLSAQCSQLIESLGNLPVIPFCPEVMGGLTIPRLPAEILHGDGNTVLNGEACVYDAQANDVTAQFIKGAESAVRYLNRQAVKVVVLKERSPSCGVNWIYDGTFTGTLREGCGVTTALIKLHHIQFYTESKQDDISSWLINMEGEV